MNTGVMFSSKTDLWETPQDFFDKLAERDAVVECMRGECGKCVNLEVPMDSTPCLDCYNGLADHWQWRGPQKKRGWISRMIEFSGTIGAEPRWLGRPIVKPGFGDPKPLKPVSTCDTQENVEVCLNCPLPACKSGHPACPLYGYSTRARRSREEEKLSRRERAVERDNRVRDLINAGWVNSEAICKELNIGKSTLSAAKKRLRERGEI